MTEERAGEVITFYSYKGGVGRSMAVANVGALLAYMGKKVLLMDFDFEAPGLHRYFGLEQGNLPSSLGVIELFTNAAARLESVVHDDSATEDVGPNTAASRFAEARDVFAELLASGSYTRKVNVKNVEDALSGQLDIALAGKFDQDYPNRVRAFHWEKVHQAHPDFFRALALELGNSYDFVLIDSRTGITDVGGVCTVLLPEKLVLVFVPNEQSLHGAVEVGAQAVAQRTDSPDLRPLPLFPLQSRLENAEDALQKKWTSDACRRFEQSFQQAYALDDCDLRYYFNAVQLPHRSIYAYGELLAVEHESLERTNSLATAYKKFVEFLTCDSVYDAQLALRGGSLTVVPSPLPLDEAKAVALPVPPASTETTAASATTSKTSSAKITLPVRMGRNALFWIAALLLGAAPLAFFLFVPGLGFATWLAADAPEKLGLDGCLDNKIRELGAKPDPTDHRAASTRYISAADQLKPLLTVPKSRGVLEKCWRDHGLGAPDVIIPIEVQVGNEVGSSNVRLDGTDIECHTQTKGQCTLNVGKLPASAPNYSFTAVQPLGEAHATLRADNLEQPVRLELTPRHPLLLRVQQDGMDIPNAQITLAPRDFDGIVGWLGCAGEAQVDCRQMKTNAKGEALFLLSRPLGKVEISISVGDDEEISQVDFTKIPTPETYTLKWTGPGNNGSPASWTLPVGTKYVVSVAPIANKSGRSHSGLQKLAQDRFLSALASVPNLFLASAAPSTEALRLQLSRRGEVASYIVSLEMQPYEYAENSLRASIEGTMASWPSKKYIGNFNVRLTQPDTPEQTAEGEVDLMGLAAESAAKRFTSIMLTQ